jgi:hypothetical protein
MHDIYTDRTLARISSGCHSCISLVNITALKTALEKRIPFILAGYTLGQIPCNVLVFRNNYRFLQDSRKAVLEKLKGHVGDMVMDHYCISEELMDQATFSPYNINLLCLEEVSEEAIVRAIEPLGWKRPVDVDGCSSNCLLNTFNNYIHMLKYGYNPYEFELSHLIRSGHLTRVAALQKIQDQPKAHIRGIMDKLGLRDSDIDSLRHH